MTVFTLIDARHWLLWSKVYVDLYGA